MRAHRSSLTRESASGHGGSDSRACRGRAGDVLRLRVALLQHGLGALDHAGVLVLQEAAELDLPLPGTALVHQLYRSNQAAGEAQDGHSSLYKVLLRLAGEMA